MLEGGGAGVPGFGRCSRLTTFTTQKMTNAMIRNWMIAVQRDEFVPEERVKVPEPAVTDRATIAAHLAAFGSGNVHKLYQAWRTAITAIEIEEAALEWKTSDNYPGPPRLRDLKHLQEVLRPDELAARQALADAIAEELGHR